jgi:NO-binding membrane sensor protein with MHYT domain
MAGMAELHHFAYGWFTPVAAYLLAFLGTVLGLGCLARARVVRARGRKARWLVLSAISIGGVAIWLMHFMAMLGFDVPAGQVRYEPVLTAATLPVAVSIVGLGLFVVGFGHAHARRTRGLRTLAGGLLIGCGAAAMHYTGVYALNVGGHISFDDRLVLASVVVPSVVSASALWITVRRRGWPSILVASTLLAAATVGVHYTGMAALRVRLDPVQYMDDRGLSPLVLVVPITVCTAAALVGMAFSALQAMTQEEFAGPDAQVARG